MLNAEEVTLDEQPLPATRHCRIARPPRENDQKYDSLTQSYEAALSLWLKELSLHLSIYHETLLSEQTHITSKLSIS